MEAGRGNGGKVQGFKSIIGSNNRQGEVKNSSGNGEAKELTPTTHGHELRGGILAGRGVPGRRGAKGGKLGQL